MFGYGGRFLMTTLLYAHKACLDHSVPEGHPERPARLEAVLSGLEAPDFQPLMRKVAPLATPAQLMRVHPEYFVEKIMAVMPLSGFHAFDPDTSASPGTRAAALRAAGAVAAAVDDVMAGKADNAFCAVRPPGHHAEPEKAMGFCFFNSIAIGALHARAAHGARRVAVVDFDVHHGNGTQAAFWDDPDLFYASTHQAPFYPGSGSETEAGRHDQGNIVNAPLVAHSDPALFRQAYEMRILPALEAFAPDLVMISAGFDAHIDDPLAQLSLTEKDFAWVTQALCDVAARRCNGRVVSVLEGGYNLEALGTSAAAHVAALMAA